MSVKVRNGMTFRVEGYDARLLLYCLLTMTSIPSCSVCKPRIEYRDSVRVEYRDRIIHDTATFYVEKEVEKIITKDTASHLENRWAVSDASVSEGLLYHSLESIPQIVKVPYEVEVHDTTYVEKAQEIVYVEKPVEKPLTWWQGLRLDAFWWLILALVLTNIKTILKWLSIL